MPPRVAIFTPTNLHTGLKYKTAGFELYLNYRGSLEILRLTTLRELLTNRFRLVSDIDERMRGVEVNTGLFAAGHYLVSRLTAHGCRTIAARQVTPRSLAALERFAPDVVCISTTFMDSPADLAEMSQRIREAAPEAKQVAGGMMVWKHFMTHRLAPPGEGARYGTLFDSGDFARASRIDAFVLQPTGIGPLFELLAQLGHRRPSFGQIPNLALRGRRGKLELTEIEAHPYDEAEEVIDWRYVDDLPRFIPLRTAVGCAHRCEFCDYCVVMDRLHLKSPATVRRELEGIRDRTGNDDRHHIYCVDDNTFVSPRRIREVCGAFTAAEIELPWYSMTAVDAVDEKNVELIKRTNLVAATVGLESGDDTVLANMNKPVNKRRFRRGARLLDQAGTSLIITLVAGFPGESLESIENTAAFLDGLQLDGACSAFTIFPLTVLPLSALASAASRERFALEGLYNDWRHRDCSFDGARRRIPIYLEKIESLHLYHADNPRRLREELDPPLIRRLLSLRRELGLRVLNGASETALRETLAGACAALEVEPVFPERVSPWFAVPKAAG